MVHVLPGIGQTRHDRLAQRDLLAAGSARALILVSPSAQPTTTYAPQIEVTLASRPSKRPDDARHIAQANQDGSGKRPITQIPVTPTTAATQSGHPSSRRTAQQKTAVRPTRLTDHRRRERAARVRQTRTGAASRTAGHQSGSRPLNQELASLQAELDEQTRAYSNRPRVRRLTSASASRRWTPPTCWTGAAPGGGGQQVLSRGLRALRYLWQPAPAGHHSARRQPGGHRVLSSSGYAVLDEAAIKIVRMAAPYAPFPPELRATTDKLEIIRTWQFQENELSSD